MSIPELRFVSSCVVIVSLIGTVLQLRSCFDDGSDSPKSQSGAD